MGRISNALALFKESWAVLRQDKELLVLPVISAAASLFTIGLFIPPILATLNTTAGEVAGTGEAEGNVFTVILMVLAYFVLAFITIFFNAALISAANERMSGGDPTVGSALRGASARTGRILPWAIVSATVSYLIRMLQERGGIFGAILGFLGGLAWSAVTFLVLPILVIEGIGVVDAMKRSTNLLRNAWGEGLAGHIGLGILGFLASLPFIAIALVGIAIGHTASITIGLVLGAVGLIAVTILMSALSMVYQTALYRFATNQPTVGFRQQSLSGAFYRK